MMNGAHFSAAPASFTQVFPSEVVLFSWIKMPDFLGFVGAEGLAGPWLWWHQFQGAEDAAPFLLLGNFGSPALPWCCSCYFGESQIFAFVSLSASLHRAWVWASSPLEVQTRNKHFFFWCNINL